MADVGGLSAGVVLFGVATLWNYTSWGKPGIIGRILLDRQGHYRKGYGWFFLTLEPLLAVFFLLSIPVGLISTSATGPLHAVRLVLSFLLLVVVVVMAIGVVKNPLFRLPRWVVEQGKLLLQPTSDLSAVRIGPADSLDQRAFELLRSQGDVTESAAAEALSLSLPKTRRLLGGLATRSLLGELPPGVLVTTCRTKGQATTYALDRPSQEM